MFNSRLTNAWPRGTLAALVADAVSSGEALAELGSPREATLFRFALYNFRRSSGLGAGLTITVEGNRVRLKRQALVIRRVATEAAQ